MQEGTTADSGRSRIIDERATRARNLELVRTLEANGLTLLAIAVARRVQHPYDRVADQAEANPGRDCQILVLDTRRSDPGRCGGHGTGGRGHHLRSTASATTDVVIAALVPAGWEQIAAAPGAVDTTTDRPRERASAPHMPPGGRDETGTSGHALREDEAIVVALAVPPG